MKRNVKGGEGEKERKREAMTNILKKDVGKAVAALSMGVKAMTGENLNGAATQAFLGYYWAVLKSRVLDEAKPVGARAQGFLQFAQGKGRRAELFKDPPGWNSAAARRVRAKSAAPASSASEGRADDENEHWTDV